MLVQGLVCLWPYAQIPPQTLLSLCLVLSLVYCFPFCVADLGCDVSAFSYASLSKLKICKMYYRGDIVVESPTKPCRTLCNQSFLLQLTVFNAFFNDVFNEFLSLSRFRKQFSQEREGAKNLRRVCPRFSDFDRLTC